MTRRAEWKKWEKTMSGPKTMMIPELGPLKIESSENGADGYLMRATMELTGRMREYEIDVVIRALEAAGYEVRKKPAP